MNRKEQIDKLMKKKNKNSKEIDKLVELIKEDMRIKAKKEQIILYSVLGIVTVLLIAGAIYTEYAL